MSLDDWVAAKATPATAGCGGYYEAERVEDGTWRLYIGHTCHKGVTFRLEWGEGTEYEYSTGAKFLRNRKVKKTCKGPDRAQCREQAIFRMGKANGKNKLGIQLGHVLPENITPIFLA